LTGKCAFPVLISTAPIFICAGILLLCNIFFLSASSNAGNSWKRDITTGFIQVECDLVILTAVLHFSGGIANPFFLFFIFHIIIATIILPKNLSDIVGLTAILMFSLLAIANLNDWTWLGYHPLRFSSEFGLWRNPVYVFGAFAAFSFTVLLSQYLTRMIIIRMTAKEAEAARNNDVLKAMISAMAEGLIFLTSDGKIAICNPAAKLWKKSDCINNTEDSIDDFQPVLAEHMKALLKGDVELDCTGTVIKFGKTGDQKSHFETKGCKVKSAEGVELGYVLVGQDLTEHKKLEKDLLEQTEKVTAINEMLKMSRVRMAQQEKMVAIGQMAAGIAHEIGNPLASLSSVAQYLGRKLNSHEQKEHLLTIDYQVNRISNILRRMLTLAKPAAAEYKWNDINELIANTISLVKFDKRMRSVAVKDVVCADLPMVWMNPQSFEQVLLNLVINAMDAMEAKGKQHERVLEISRAYDDGIIEIRVRDTGIGMSPDVCKRAFDSFFTTKEIGKGTGLGLFISYNLVAEMDGTIEMDSESGVGTIVIVKIPVRPKNALFSDRKDGYSSSVQIKEN